MADLSISSSNGTQTSTQSPQSLVSSGNGTEAATSVQPGTSTDLLRTSTGIQLRPNQLSIVNVGSASPSSASSVSSPTVQPKHHINSGLLAISIGLFVIAVVVFLMINRSAKNTTNY